MIRDTISNYIITDKSLETHRVKINILLESLCKQGLIESYSLDKCELAQESEDIKSIREVMETPSNGLHVVAQMQLTYSLNLLSLDIVIGD